MSTSPTSVHLLTVGALGGDAYSGRGISVSFHVRQDVAREWVVAPIQQALREDGREGVGGEVSGLVFPYPIVARDPDNPAAYVSPTFPKATRPRAS